MYTNLETRRLSIRPITLNDADFILRLVNSEGWLKFIGDRKVFDRKDAEQYIQNILDDDQSFYNVFETRDSNRAIGILTLLKRQDERFPDIGFAILSEHEKKGYSYEAASAYLDELQQSGKYQSLIAFTLPTNKNSIRLLKKLGMKYAGDKIREDESLCYFRTK